MKIIYKTIIMLSVLLFTFSTVTATNIEKSGSVTIGSKKKNCDGGFGICGASKSTRTSKPGAVKSTFVYDAKANTLLIKIAKTDLQARAASKLKYFSNQQWVTIEDEFTMPTDLQTAFKARQPLIIKKGKYPLTYQKGVYCITIHL